MARWNFNLWQVKSFSSESCVQDGPRKSDFSHLFILLCHPCSCFGSCKL